MLKTLWGVLGPYGETPRDSANIKGGVFSDYGNRRNMSRTPKGKTPLGFARRHLEFTRQMKMFFRFWQPNVEWFCAGESNVGLFVQNESRCRERSCVRRANYPPGKTPWRSGFTTFCLHARKSTAQNPGPKTARGLSPSPDPTSSDAKRPGFSRNWPRPVLQSLHARVPSVWLSTLDPRLTT
jgi:hypothetical protein